MKSQNVLCTQVLHQLGRRLTKSIVNCLVVNVTLMFFSVGVSALSVRTATAQGAVQEIIPDANTVILDHFNGATGGTPVGVLAFATSLNGLGQAAVLGVGNYVKYAFAAWGSGQGTVEMWISLNSLPATYYEVRLLNVNWNNTGSYPGAGHVLHFFISKSNGDVAGGSFWPSGGALGTTSIPVGMWTHLALSWGLAGTKIYVNGNLQNVGAPGGPSLIGTNYAYLNYWGTFAGGGTPFDGLIDEFHLSNVQRSDADVAQHATLTPVVIEVDIDIKPGSFPNSINPNSNGVIPVAILTTPSFDATTVDPMSVKFGPGETMESHGMGHIQDADGDGDDDLVLHFKTKDASIPCGATQASLAGKTLGGQDITGTDAIQTVRCTAKAAAQEEAGFPEGYALLQSYPNPFNPETEIRFQLPELNHVVVKIFNINGEEIRTLVDADYEAGYHRVRWDGKDKNSKPVASGVYLYQLQVVDPVNGGTGSFTQVKKMSLLR